MLVRNCGGFYVYKLGSMPSFNYSFRFCGAGVEGNTRCPTKRKALDSCFFFYCIHMNNDTSLTNSANGKVRNFALFFPSFLWIPTHTLVKFTKKLSIGYNVDSDKEKKSS